MVKGEKKTRNEKERKGSEGRREGRKERGKGRGKEGEREGEREERGEGGKGRAGLEVEKEEGMREKREKSKSKERGGGWEVRKVRRKMGVREGREV